MSRSSRQQIFFSRILAIVFIVGGSAAGCMLGRQAVIWESLSKLNQVSKSLVTQNDTALADARHVLESMAGAISPVCTDNDIGRLRDIVFQNANLKDAGRIQENTIRCSANSGRSLRALASLGVLASRTEGELTYYRLKKTIKSDLNRGVLQLGNAFVVVDPGQSLNQDAGPVRLNVSIMGGEEVHANSNAGPAPKVDESALPLEGSGHHGETLYATHCSSLGLDCITLSIPVSYVIQNSNIAIAISSAVGAMTGLLLWSLLMKIRSQSQDMPSQLKRALEHDKLEVAYQPIVNLATQKIIGAEALARWTNEDGEQVPPEIFVKVAEERGVVGKITKSVLRHILNDFAATLRDRPGFRISMNVAADDLSDPAFLPMMDESLQRANVKPESIVIEITERSAIDGPGVRETIRNLRRSGYAIHIDDFGTGHSNLDKLLYLYADTIKIDKAFTQVIGTESVTAAILPQILDMANTLGLGVVVEGVETRMQSDYFDPNRQKIHAQGWLYGRPGTADALKNQLNNEPAVPVQPKVAVEPPVEVPVLATETETLYLVKRRSA